MRWDDMDDTRRTWLGMILFFTAIVFITLVFFGCSHAQPEPEEVGSQDLQPQDSVGADKIDRLPSLLASD